MDADLQILPTGEDQYRVAVGSEQLDLRIYRSKGVVRCSLGSGQVKSSGAITGAAFGGSIGVDTVAARRRIAGAVLAAAQHPLQAAHDARVRRSRWFPIVASERS